MTNFDKLRQKIKTDYEKGNRKYKEFQYRSLNIMEKILVEVGNEKFLNIISSALSMNNKDFPLDEIIQKIEIMEKFVEMEEEQDYEFVLNYYMELSKFNKNFIINNLTTLSIDKSLKILLELMEIGTLSTDFLDAIKLHPDAPAEYRNSLKIGIWDK